MGLLDECRQEQASRKANQCRIRALLSEMDKSDKADLEAALSDMNIQHVTITNVLRQRGYEIGKHTVATHRRGICGCSR
jgi:lipoate synthase